MTSDTTLRALNRFGLGARVGERSRIRDPRGWLMAQLQGGPAVLPESAGAAPAEVAEVYRAVNGIGRFEVEERRRIRQHVARIAASEARAVLTARVATDRPFVERLVAFWSNHLCVSAGTRLPVALLAGDYEREVVRPHVLGRFDDMVLASARHPAMLFYLDNRLSIGPGSGAARAAEQRGARRGLNENYARELLELHTLGVDGGYAQQDVLALARILTGWTAAAPPGPDAALPGFNFRARLHEPGAKVLLGVRYDEAGAAEGERAIRDLCRHPSTATFVARKLVTHFVADEPPEAAVKRTAAVFLETGGDLRAVAAALVELPDPWTTESRKFRTPQDWLVAVLRAFGANEVEARVLPALRQLRHPLWSPQSPRGFGDTTREWADPDSLLNRAGLARTLARRSGRPRPDPRGLLDVVDAADAAPLRGLLADGSIAGDERTALAVASPSFQWR